MKSQVHQSLQLDTPARTVLASAISAIFAGGAVQSADAQEQTPQEQAVEEITVTGSRIARRDLSASPIVTVDADSSNTNTSASKRRSTSATVQWPAHRQ